MLLLEFSGGPVVWQNLVHSMKVFQVFLGPASPDGVLPINPTVFFLALWQPMKATFRLPLESQGNNDRFSHVTVRLE